MAKTPAPKTLLEAVRYYSDPQVCQDELVAARWPDSVTCPTCGSKKVGYLANQRRWQCSQKHPRRQFSVKVGTIFEDSPIGLDKWFVTMWMLANCKNGVSSYEIARGIGVTQKTAWFMLHRLRLAMQTRSFRKMSGEVEADETYIGGKARNMHHQNRIRLTTTNRADGKASKSNRWAGKIAVMGLLERDNDGASRVVTMPVENVRKHQVRGIINEHVEEGASLYTDDLNSYKHLSSDYDHRVVNHAHTYVDGRVHTNGLESFWSMLKRTLGGTYVSVEAFHLFRYLDEQAFRYNNRKWTDATRFGGVLDSVTGRRVMYKELTGKTHGRMTADSQTEGAT
jgi:transposase-like protein